MGNQDVTSDGLRRKKEDATTGKSDHSGSATSRPAGSVFGIGELNESTDQQLFNSIHRPFTAGFANILPGIRFDAGGFVATMGAVAAVNGEILTTVMPQLWGTIKRG